ncbi:Ras, Miro, and/or Arf domain containing protein [Asbolus verrucosus]|uniref:Ras, Miro, and/or Arf domain containing protein n=1 Tax=Asbolus verrucosus TaxID=1661398 RepID=A0A482W4J3_ASBVE|nr:Ras, Miro, and/or Arf domain containing protein [Asbolus verrucosus]
MKTIVGKVVILGSVAVGKTSIVLRYVNNSFDCPSVPTIGASFVSCTLLIEDITVKLQIWDTAGAERFKALAPMFYRNANAAIIVFDVTFKPSFESVRQWIAELKTNVKNPMKLYVVGNKVDLAERREISRHDAEQYAESIGATYHECSAKQEKGVGLVFDDIARGLIEMSGSGDGHNLKVYDTENIDNRMANCSEETVNLSVSGRTHKKSVKRKCC